MNNGAFGENFPYTNFHDLNMDWIVKIAKDFLDQYTHIQEVIANGEESLQNLTTSGLEQLQNKADALEALLQQWYDTHSADIANQLADALEDMNKWYNEHIDLISTELASAISAFDSSAKAKGEEVLESIPADYTLLGHKVTELENYTGIHTKTAVANSEWPYIIVGEITAGEYRITLLDETSDNIDHNIQVFVDNDQYANNLPLHDEHTYTLGAGTLKFTYQYSSTPTNPPELTFQISKVGDTATILDRTYKNSDSIENTNSEIGYFHNVHATANGKWPYLSLGNISGGSKYRIKINSIVTDAGSDYYVAFVDNTDVTYASGLQIGEEYIFTLNENATSARLNFQFSSAPTITPILTYEFSKIGDDTVIGMIIAQKDSIENTNSEIGYFPNVHATANSKWPYLSLGNISGGSKYRIRINSIVTDAGSDYYVAFVDNTGVTYASGLQIGEEYVFTLIENATSARLNFQFSSAPTITPILTYEFSKISDDTVIGMITTQKFATVTVIVASDGTGQFTKISDAVNWAKEHSGTNRWGNIWFKIYVKSGTYIEEPYDGWPYAPIYINGFKCILTGEDKDTTIIQLTNTSGHDNRVIDVRAEAVIENFTIKCLKDDTYTSLGNNAYAIHNDGSPSPAPAYDWKTVIRNCVLISECSQPIGAGLQNLQTQIYENVTCILENGANVIDGALYVHAAGDNTAIPNGVIIDSCTLINNNGGESLIMPNVTGSLPYNSIDVTIRRTITSTSGQTEINPQFKNSHKLTKDSKLNSNEYLNY